MLLVPRFPSPRNGEDAFTPPEMRKSVNFADQRSERVWLYRRKCSRWVGESAQQTAIPEG